MGAPPNPIVPAERAVIRRPAVEESEWLIPLDLVLARTSLRAERCGKGMCVAIART